MQWSVCGGDVDLRVLPAPVLLLLPDQHLDETDQNNQVMGQIPTLLRGISTKGGDWGVKKIV